MVDKEIWEQYIRGELPEIDRGLDKAEEIAGEVADEVVLDLHNHTESQAYEAIRKALRQAKKLSCQRLRIITWKGNDYPEVPGRLFTIVPRWLEVMQEKGKIRNFKQEKLGIIQVAIIKSS
jgi:DNA-nicking Smr family endonuclease